MEYTQEQLMNRFYGAHIICHVDNNCYKILEWDEELDSYIVAYYDGWYNDCRYHHKVTEDEAGDIINKAERVNYGNLK